MTIKYKKELVIGICVILSFLILFFGIDFLKGVNIFKATNYYYASYTNVAGLAQSAPVTINGYKIGLVRDISYDYNNPGHVRVEMSLNKELRLPEGTEAILVTDMLGTSSIELNLGHSNTYHQVGHELKGVRSTGLMEAVNNSVMPNINSILPKVDSLITNLNRLAGDPALQASIASLESTMKNLNDASAKLSQTMKRMPAIAGNASDAVANAKDLTADLAQLTAKLKSAPIDSTLTNLYQMSEKLNHIVGQLNSPNSSAGLLLNDKQLYNNLNNAAAALDSLLIDVKKNPKRYISIKLF